ncbi:hypothetical protein MTO96_031492 [Rhipicephalus appendiculatus]
MQPHGEHRLSSFLLGVCQGVLEGSAPAAVRSKVRFLEPARDRSAYTNRLMHTEESPRESRTILVECRGGTIVHTRLIYVLTAERLRLSASAF